MNHFPLPLPLAPRLVFQLILYRSFNCTLTAKTRSQELFLSSLSPSPCVSRVCQCLSVVSSSSSCGCSDPRDDSSTVGSREADVRAISSDSSTCECGLLYSHLSRCTRLSPRKCLILHSTLALLCQCCSRVLLYTRIVCVHVSTASAFSLSLSLSVCVACLFVMSTENSLS